MTNTMQDPIDCTSRDQNAWPLDSLKIEAELEKLDRQVGHEYLPMDAFVDPKTMKEHFQISSIRARWPRNRQR